MLISEAQALAYLGLSAADPRLTLLLEVTNQLVLDYCNRAFFQATYLEWQDGTGLNWISVAEYPLAAVYRVGVQLKDSLALRYESTTADKAFVRVDKTLLELRSTTDGIETVTQLTFAIYKTLDDLAVAAGLVAGWLAVAYDTKRASVDLAPRAGAYALNRNVGLLAVFQEEEGYEVDGEAGRIILRRDTVRGFQNTLVHYLGGYVALPGRLTADCLKVLALLYAQAKRDPSLISEDLDNYSWTGSSNLSLINQAAARIMDTWRAPIRRR